MNMNDLGECCDCGPPMVACSPCSVPASNLTLSWTNAFIGAGSTTLVFDGVNRWTSACVNQLIHSLACVNGVLTFSSSYFTSGSCPTGTRQTCSNGDGPPRSLPRTAYTCSPFMMRFSVTNTGCPGVASYGYGTFTVTE